MNDDMNFYKLDRIRKYFMRDNGQCDHFFKKGVIFNILISAPHAVSQVRLGRNKVSEIGSLKTALWLGKKTGVSCLIKTKNNYDDANWDEKSEYKDCLFSEIENNDIRYILDFHGLGSHRLCDVNLGTNMGKNIENDIPLFDWLVNKLKRSGIVVCIDQPFNAGNHTISGSSKIKFNHLWTLQIEINTNITNKIENFEKYRKIIQVFTEFIDKINRD